LLKEAGMTLHRAPFAGLLFLAASCGSSAEDGGNGGGNVGFGGAQDIGQFRAILDAGGIPGENTLDANGFFAEHYSESPPADCGQELCAVGQMAVGRDWIRESDSAVVQISLTTPVDPATLERRPLNLVVVMDTSGSMTQDDRIGYARTGLHTLIDEMQEGDRLALVTYSDGVTEWNRLEEALDRPALHAIADQLTAAGSTNLYGGLERGFQVASAGFDPERQNRILLMSDGLPTTGITDDASIQQMAERYVSDGMGLTTIGVGLDFNVDLMRGLAERGAGNFYFLESPTAIAEVFREELDYFSEPLAFDVELSVSAANRGWSVGEVIGTRYWSGSAAGGSVTMPAVFVASRVSDQPGEYGRRGAGGALFLTVRPDSGSVWQTRGPVADVTVRYRLPGSSEVVSQTITIASEASDGDLWLSRESMAEHYAMLSMYRGLREATRQAEWNHDCALGALDRLDQKAATWNSTMSDPDIEADRLLIAQFAGNLREQGASSLAADYAASCPLDGSGYPYPDEHIHYCSAAGGGGSPTWLALAIALLIVYRRRRR
jgi:Ca-activated chloride channel family protein